MTSPPPPPPPPPSPSPAKVQQVSKASSDKLLRKFATLDDCLAPKPPSKKTAPIPFSGKESSAMAGPTRRTVKRKRNSGGQAVAEWKRLLPGSPWRLSAPAIRRRRHADAEFSGISRLLASVEKTWNRTIQGATKVFIERNSRHHVRLISDAI